MKTIEIKVYKFDELDKQTKEKVIDTIEANDFEADILSYLKAEYEYQISDEALDEFFMNNDYDFTTEGKIY